MSVRPNDLRFYGSVHMSDGEGTTQGGAIDFGTRISFYDISPAGTVDYISSSTSDTTPSLTVTGLDSSGVSRSETKTLNGQTAVLGSQSFERLEKVTVSQVSPANQPVGDVAVVSHTAVLSGHTMQTGSADGTGTTPPVAKLQSGDGASVAAGQIILITSGTGAHQIRQIQAVNPGGIGADFVSVDRDWGTIPDNTSVYSIYQGFYLPVAPTPCWQVRRLFPSATADVGGGSSREFYEKIFAVNDNTVTALTSAVITKESDPAQGTLDIALTNSLNDTATVANRQTAPASGITAYTSGGAPQSINVPSPQNLPPGATPNTAGAQGIWVRLTLAAGATPGKSSWIPRIAGSTA